MNCTPCFSRRVYAAIFLFSLLAVVVPLDGSISEIDYDTITRAECQRRGIPLHKCRVFVVRNTRLTNDPKPGEHVIWQGEVKDETGTPYAYVVAA